MYVIQAFVIIVIIRCCDSLAVAVASVYLRHLNNAVLYFYVGLGAISMSALTEFSMSDGNIF